MTILMWKSYFCFPLGILPFCKVPVGGDGIDKEEAVDFPSAANRNLRIHKPLVTQMNNDGRNTYLLFTNNPLHSH